MELLAKLLITFLIGGIAGRIRGAGNITVEGQKIVIPNWVARFIIWGFPVGIAILFTTGDIVYTAAGIILAGIGASAGYWGTFDLFNPANRTLSNYAKLTVMGCYRFFPLFVGSAYIGLEHHILPAVFAGVAFVPAYLLGLKLAPIKLPLLTSFTEWGEFFFWGTIFTALVAGL